MSAFLTFVEYMLKVFRTGDALNEFVNKLPWAVQEHAVALGEWIKSLLAGGG